MFTNYDHVTCICLQNIKKMSFTNTQSFYKLSRNQNHWNIESNTKNDFNNHLNFFYYFQQRPYLISQLQQ